MKLREIQAKIQALLAQEFVPKLPQEPPKYPFPSQMNIKPFSPSKGIVLPDQSPQIKSLTLDVHETDSTKNKLLSDSDLKSLLQQCQKLAELPSNQIVLLRVDTEKGEARIVTKRKHVEAETGAVNKIQWYGAYGVGASIRTMNLLGIHDHTVLSAGILPERGGIKTNLSLTRQPASKTGIVFSNFASYLGTIFKSKIVHYATPTTSLQLSVVKDYSVTNPKAPENPSTFVSFSLKHNNDRAYWGFKLIPSDSFKTSLCKMYVQRHFQLFQKHNFDLSLLMTLRMAAGYSQDPRRLFKSDFYINDKTRIVRRNLDAVLVAKREFGLFRGGAYLRGTWEWGGRPGGEWGVMGESGGVGVWVCLSREKWLYRVAAGE